MNRLELVSAVAEKTGVSAKDSEKVINATIETIKELLKKGDTLTLVGFGTFSTHSRKETEARNPKTGEKIAVPAKVVAKFKASSKILA